MKKILLVALVTFLIIEFIAWLQTPSRSRLDYLSFGLLHLILAAVCFFVGLALTLVKQTTEIGKGILIATAVVLVIGLAVCSR